MPATSSSSTCTFTGAGGQQLAARIDRPVAGVPVLGSAVFAHCFTCSKDLRAARRLSRALADSGIAVMSFDFTGLGQSGGDFADGTFSADVDDLVAASEYLSETVMPPALLVGQSLGGAAVLTAAPRILSVVAIATIGAPADVKHVTKLFESDVDAITAEGEAAVSIGGRSFTVRSSFVEDLSDQRLLDTVEELDAAVLLLHAPRDQIVGIENAAELFDAARHPKSFISLDDADHLLTDDGDARYVAGVVASWAARYMPQPVPDASRSAPGERATTVSAYEDDTVVARSIGGLAADVSVRGFTMRVDEPASAGGGETGPTPYDHLGAALASCTTLTLRMYADRKGLDVTDISTSVRFDRVHADDCEGCEERAHLVGRFTRTVTVTGAITDDLRQRLLRIADLCPVHKTLEGEMRIATTLTS